MTLYAHTMQLISLTVPGLCLAAVTEVHILFTQKNPKQNFLAMGMVYVCLADFCSDSNILYIATYPIIIYIQLSNHTTVYLISIIIICTF